ncbi:integral membrane protein GPR137C [Spea bombifrons]|uniref:integral membrane protein GPR137C n=1 Tax=Spea bombifrons TaxID=233779 RepID=UPI00234B5368|nr:integral membrane protein GPR137C [Spea bombifrons]
MQAAIPRAVELWLTVLCTALSSALFLIIYLQLWLLLHYKQKRLSYQSLFLFLCLLWAGFRTLLYSFYLTSCAQANALRPFPHWLPYCTPVCLQFFTLCLLNLYFSQVVIKARCSPEFNNYKIPLRLGFLFISVAFLIVNLSCTLIGNQPGNRHSWISLAKMIISDCLFAICSISLANYVCQIASASPAYVYLESKGASGNQAVLTCAVTGTVYFLRSCYNLVVVFTTPVNEQSPFSYGWNGVTDHAATEQIDGLEYLISGILFICCEVLPMSLMICFFRAKKPNQNLEAGGMVNSHSFGSRAYFFDNPRRYDSDDDLPRLAGGKGERESLPSPPKTSSWYGTICPSGSCALSPPLLGDPSSGTPVLFTCGTHTLS